MPSDARNDPMEEAPRHRRKRKHRPVRSDHKHDYEKVCIDAHDKVWIHGEGTHRYYRIGERCRVCGRLASCSSFDHLREPPEDMPLYDVGGLDGLFEKVLSEEKKVK